MEKFLTDRFLHLVRLLYFGIVWWSSLGSFGELLSSSLSSFDHKNLFHFSMHLLPCIFCWFSYSLQFYFQSFLLTIFLFQDCFCLYFWLVYLILQWRLLKKDAMDTLQNFPHADQHHLEDRIIPYFIHTYFWRYLFQTFANQTQESYWHFIG